MKLRYIQPWTTLWVVSAPSVISPNKVSKFTLSNLKGENIWASHLVRLTKIRFFSNLVINMHSLSVLDVQCPLIAFVGSNLFYPPPHFLFTLNISIFHHTGFLTKGLFKRFDENFFGKWWMIFLTYQLSRGDICVTNFIPPANGAS